METTLHTLDPDGDVILVLHNPGAPFAVWNESAEPDPEPEPEKERPVAADLELEPIADIHYRVSSKHLALASQYFKRVLAGPWIENKQTSDACRYLSADDWDPEALLLLMKIIHGRNGSLPRKISLELLAKIAILVDYYDCYEAVAIIAGLWIRDLEKSKPKTLSRDLILWIVVAWVFRDHTLKTITGLAVQHSKGLILMKDLPISKILGAVEARRQECIDGIISGLFRVLDRYRDGTDGCSFECSSILLGALEKEMFRFGIFQPRPEPPYSGYSVAATITMVRDFSSPEWFSYDGTSYPHHCTFESFSSLIGNAQKLVQGFELSDVMSDG